MPSLSEFEGYLVLDAELVNNSDRAQPYSPIDWRVQTPSGTVRDHEWVLVEVEGQLESADLVPGAAISGKVFFNVGEEKGTFYVLYKPGPFDATRGVWGLTFNDLAHHGSKEGHPPWCPPFVSGRLVVEWHGA